MYVGSVAVSPYCVPPCGAVSCKVHLLLSTESPILPCHTPASTNLHTNNAYNVSRKNCNTGYYVVSHNALWIFVIFLLHTSSLYWQQPHRDQRPACNRNKYFILFVSSCRECLNIPSVRTRPIITTNTTIHHHESTGGGNFKMCGVLNIQYQHSKYTNNPLCFCRC